MSSPLLVRDTEFVRVSRCVLGGLIQVAMQKERKNHTTIPRMSDNVCL